MPKPSSSVSLALLTIGKNTLLSSTQCVNSPFTLFKFLFPDLFVTLFPCLPNRLSPLLKRFGSSEMPKIKFKLCLQILDEQNEEKAVSSVCIVQSQTIHSNIPSSTQPCNWTGGRGRAFLRRELGAAKSIKIVCHRVWTTNASALVFWNTLVIRNS